MFFDHAIATTIILSTFGAFYGGMPRYIFTGAFVSLLLVSPMSWWLYKHGKFNSVNKQVNIFYENDLTREDIDRIRHIDMIESLADKMRGQPGYGYHIKDPRYV